VGGRGSASQAQAAKPPSHGTTASALLSLCWWDGDTGTALVTSKQPRTCVLVKPSPLLNSQGAQGAQVTGLPFLQLALSVSSCH